MLAAKKYITKKNEHAAFHFLLNTDTTLHRNPHN